MSDTIRKHRKTNKLALLAQYELIKASLRDHSTIAHKGEALEIVKQKLLLLKQLYNQVQLESNRDTLIQLKDSEIFEDTSKFAALNAQNLKLGSLGNTLASADYEAQVSLYMSQDILLDSEQLSTPETRFNSFNWLKMGALFLLSSSKPILIDSLYGPLETERKRLQPRTRMLDDTTKLSLSTARNMDADDLNDNHELNTAHMVKEVYRQYFAKSNGERVNFYKFFLNPHSFSQSVENLFFTSFLVRDGRLQIYLDNGIPFILVVEPNDSDSVATEGSHHIATLDHLTWQLLLKKYNITESYLDNRIQEEDTWEGED